MYINMISLVLSSLFLNIAQAEPHFMQKLPPVVKHLALLEPNFVSAPKVVRVYPLDTTDPNKRLGLGAQRTSIEWIRKIINPKWLPDDPNYLKQNMIMAADKARQTDIMYVAWESHGYSIINVQTCTAFVIKIILPSQKHLQIKRETALDVQNLCNSVLNSDANIVITEPNGHDIITKRHISDDFAKNCFDKGKIELFDDGIHGEHRDFDANDRQNQNWDRWWRKLSWWTDGKTVGFYTVKVDGGAWMGSFDSDFDKGWFDGTAGTKKISGRKFDSNSPIRQPHPPHRPGDLPPMDANAGGRLPP